MSGAVRDGESALEEIVGSAHVRSGEAASRHAVAGVGPRLAVLPGTREELAAVVLHAATQGWGLVPWGGGTATDMGFPPRRLDLTLLTERLDRVVDYQPDDMTVTVEPGLKLAALRRVLAERGQFLPLDPPQAEQATAGGVVASAASGPLRAAYGTPRDWVIGCRVVGADGREVRGGGQVVKNVAGYDLPKLYTGSFGTLGVITEVTFKVLPRPPARGYCRVLLPTLDGGESLLAAALNSDLQPAAVELAEAEPGWSLLFQFLHVREAVQWQLQELGRMAKELGAGVELPAPEEGDAAIRAADAACASAFAAEIRAAAPRVLAAAGAARACCRRHGAAAAITAHAATGQVSVTAGAATAALARDLRAAAGSLGAACVFPRLPPELRGTVDPWGEPAGGLALMRAIKQQLDPAGLFSPGRFVGGI